ncbi:MAG: hypothetical protein RRB22_12565, partial [Gammaproteobacteria bacterium]|nr:hypothetical protein [Gammaproteobacteria bacterium]
RLDCESEASHNLNRLLDKPGIEATHYENIFLKVTGTRGVKPGISVDIATVAVAQALNGRFFPDSG